MSLCNVPSKCGFESWLLQTYVQAVKKNNQTVSKMSIDSKLYHHGGRQTKKSNDVIHVRLQNEAVSGVLRGVAKARGSRVVIRQSLPGHAEGISMAVPQLRISRIYVTFLDSVLC